MTRNLENNVYFGEMYYLQKHATNMEQMMLPTIVLFQM